MDKNKIQVKNAVLLLYRHPLTSDASTIMEYVEAFEKYSKFRVWTHNTEEGFLRELDEIQFDIIVFHYSLFGSLPFGVYEAFASYLARNPGKYNVAIFQDEYHNCPERFEFIRNFNIDCIFTLIEPQYFKDTYEKYTQVRKIIHCLPGYVSDKLIASSKHYAIPDEKRPIDIGYRGRRLPYYIGKTGHEKIEIAEKFVERAKDTGLRLDIDTQENRRIYGKGWYKFLASCKGVLGSESGASIFDIDGSLTNEYLRFAKAASLSEVLQFETTISFEEVSKIMHFEAYENNPPNRTMSPRTFEAAAFRNCQILFEGEYTGILKPMVHYLPLNKDFSNFDEIIRLFQDPQVRKKITDNTYQDLISSEKYHYKKFIRDFDQVLLDAGMKPENDPIEHPEIFAKLNKGKRRERVKTLIRRGLTVIPRSVIRGLYRITNHFNFHPGTLIPLRIRKHIDSIILRFFE